MTVDLTSLGLSAMVRRRGMLAAHALVMALGLLLILLGVGIAALVGLTGPDLSGPRFGRPPDPTAP